MDLVQQERRSESSMKTIISLCGRKRSGKESAYKLMLPYVEKPAEFQFATPIKKFLIDVLGLSHGQCYGTTEERESITKYRWEDIAKHIREKYGKETGFLTAREIHQVFGTDLMREEFYSKIWAEGGVRAALNSTAQTCVFSDTRFPNEVEACCNPEVNSIIVRLYRETGLQDSHESETALDIYDVDPNQRFILAKHHEPLYEMGYSRITDILWRKQENSLPYDYLIDNNHTLEHLNESIIFILKDKGIFVKPNLS